MDKWPNLIELDIFNGPEVLTFYREHGSILAYYMTGDEQIVLVKRDTKGCITKSS
jgi:hypothetical protein